MSRFIEDAKRRISESDFGDEFVDVDYERLETTKEKKHRLSEERRKEKELERKRKLREERQRERDAAAKKKEEVAVSFDEPEDSEELEREGFFEEINSEEEPFDSSFDVEEADVGYSELDDVESYTEDEEVHDEDSEETSLEDLYEESDFEGENYFEGETTEEVEENGEKTVDKLKGQASSFWNKLKEDGKKNKEKKTKKKEVEKASEKEIEDSNNSFAESAFDIDENENEGLLKKIAKKGKKTKEDRVKSAKDILEVLNIPETYTIGEEFYMPEDLNLKNITFSYTSPVGFDEREVERFYNGVVRTVKNYVEILQERNKHIVTLASEVDKKDDLIAKLRYDQEIAQGINVMPTQGDHELENELMEERLENKRLRQQLKAQKSSLANAKNTDDNVKLTDEERDKYNELQDSYSVLQKQHDDQDKVIRDLRAKVRLLEEDSGPDFENFFETNKTEVKTSPSAFDVEKDPSPKKPKVGLPQQGSRSIGMPKKPKQTSGNPFMDDD